jgi:hypothetical protein
MFEKCRAFTPKRVNEEREETKRKRNLGRKIKTNGNEIFKYLLLCLHEFHPENA